MSSISSIAIEKTKEALGKLERYQDYREKQIMESNPDSYFMKECSLFSGKDEEPTLYQKIKPEFYPYDIDETIVKIFKDISYNDMAMSYDAIRYGTGYHCNKILKIVMRELYSGLDLGLYDAVQMGSCHWLNYNRFDDETTLKIFTSICNDLKTPINNDSRFDAQPIYSRCPFGYSDRSHLLDEKLYKSRYMNEETFSYDEIERSRVYMDARLGFMFYFKNKPAFLVSFYIDNDMNVFVRQIQGQYKGRGHYVLGKEWQKTVIEYLKENLSFANDIYVISADSSFNYGIATYYNKDEEVTKNIKKSALPVIKKASRAYDMFKSKHTIKHSSTQSLTFGVNIKIEDTFYLA